MIELGPGAELFRMLGGIFWLIFITAILGAALIPKTKKGKTIAVAGVLGMLLLFPGRQIVEKVQRENAARTRLAEAEKRFQEHCKTAGEFIQKTVENVDGILVMKVRPEGQNFGDQYKMDDPYGHDLPGDGYIGNFLRARNEKGHLTEAAGGYRYVDVIDPSDGKRYRYTGAVREVTRISSPLIGGDGKPFKTTAFVLDKIPSVDPQPRYGVTYDDISTHEDREYWIAGSSLRVIDLQTNVVIAERIGYMMDRGQGATGQGGSHPAWDRARDHACPSNPATDQTRNFVEKSLRPIQEN